MTAQEFFKNDRFATNAGVELIEIKEGYSKARLVITAEHLNAGGRTQGGAIFTLADLAPYPRLSYDQGIRNSLYYAEELHIAEAVDKSIVVTDRATLFNLIIGLDGYTISSGILSEDLNGSQITSIPLESPEHMELGYVKRADRPLSSVAERYLQLLQEYVNEYQREAGE